MIPASTLGIPEPMIATSSIFTCSKPGLMVLRDTDLKGRRNKAFTLGAGTT